MRLPGATDSGRDMGTGWGHPASVWYVLIPLLRLAGQDLAAVRGAGNTMSSLGILADVGRGEWRKTDGHADWNPPGFRQHRATLDGFTGGRLRTQEGCRSGFGS
jgi:hypothetical protein